MTLTNGETHQIPRLITPTISHNLNTFRSDKSLGSRNVIKFGRKIKEKTTYSPFWLTATHWLAAK